jgi:diguanylate cyclase (GGDEF)-like protein
MNTSENAPTIYNGRYQVQPPQSDSRFQRAFDNVDNSTVIIETLSNGPRSESAEPGDLDQLRALTSLDHRCLLTVKDIFSNADGTFIVAESIDGRTLQDLFSASRPPTLTQLMRWFDQLLDVIGFLHTGNASFLHNDIAPHNVCVTDSGNLKLKYPAVALELTREAGNEPYQSLEMHWKDLDMSSRMVISRFFEGESEILLKSPLDERSDIYSASALLYFALTSTVPVDAVSRATEVAATGRDPLIAPTLINPSVSEPVSDVVMKGIQIRRENRYSTASEMRAALADALSGLYDSLTRLPNEIQFAHHIRGAIRNVENGSSGPFAIMLFDVNGLDDIAARLGGSARDQVLLTISDLLKSSLRTNDVIALIGSNRFGLLLLEAARPDDLKRVVERIQSRLDHPFFLEGEEEKITTTAGIVVSAKRGNDPEHYFLEAASAIQSAKELGTSHCIIYDRRS